MSEDDRLLRNSGGYRKLKSFQIAQLIYDITVRFVELYVDKRSRTCDQMVQAARSGVQNIAEGSVSPSKLAADVTAAAGIVARMASTMRSISGS